MEMSGLPVVIIGAGFSGLLLGQGLHKHNIPFEIFEQEEATTGPKGHRFRLDTDGTEAVYDVLSEELAELFAQTCPKLIDPRPAFWNPRTLAALDAKPRASKPGRGPSPIDRTWMLSLLSLGIENQIHRGRKFQSYRIAADGVHVSLVDGEEVHCRLLIGADGIHSKVRVQLQPGRKLVDMERQMIWGRTTISPQFLNEWPEWAMRWTVFLDQEFPERNLILEPIIWAKDVSEVSNNRLHSQKDYVYWAFSTEVPSQSPRTNAEKAAYVSKTTQGWHSSARALFDFADWDLAVRARIHSSKPDIGTWPNGAGVVTLVGDAAHPMSPMGGLGGNTVALTAADLCKTLADEGISPESVARFERRMRERATAANELTFATAKYMWKGKEWYEYDEIEERA